MAYVNVGMNNGNPQLQLGFKGLGHAGGHNKWEPSDWRSQIFACCDDLCVLCCTCVCPCFQYQKNVQALMGRAGFDCWGCYIAPWLICLVSGITGTWWYYGCSFRTALRRKFKIQSDCCCADCLCHLFCFPCALAQEGRELKIREREANEKGIPWQ